MARSVEIRQASGNSDRSAMLKFLMDGNLTVPTAWDVGVTVTTEQDDGTDINAAEAVLAATSGVTNNEDAIQALVAAINTNIPTAKSWYSKNSVDEYIVHVLPITGQSARVTLATALFEAS